MTDSAPAPTYATERTALAWRRTAVAAIGTSAVLAKPVLMNDWLWPPTEAIVTCCIAVLLTTALVAVLRSHRMRRPPPMWLLPAVSLAVVGVAVAAAVLVVRNSLA